MSVARRRAASQPGSDCRSGARVLPRRGRAPRRPSAPLLLAASFLVAVAGRTYVPRIFSTGRCSGVITPSPAQHDRALDDVAQLADVARPAVAAQQRERSPATAPSACARRRAPACDAKRAGQRARSRAARSRSGGIDERGRAQAEVQVLAKRAARDRVSRGRDSSPRRSARRSCAPSRPPTRRTSPSSITRSSFACSRERHARRSRRGTPCRPPPISSRPGLPDCAPVNAPRS